VVRTALVIAFVSSAFAASSFAHDENDLGPEYDVYRVMSSGSVTIRDDASVAGIPLKKGKYLFGHRVDNGRHVITLNPLGERSPSYDIVTAVVPEPRAPKTSELLVKEFPDRSRVLVLIAVADETGDHLPQSAISR